VNRSKKKRGPGARARGPVKGKSASVFIQSHVGRKGVPTARSFETWVRAALRGQKVHGQVNIQLFGLREARALNRKYRTKDYATNVLSFPYEPLPNEHTALLGDIAICPAVVTREAREQGKLLRDHFAHLTVHGVLHLLGHDHQTRAEAERMEGVERKILAGLGIGDPYV
jgi:probable rRNA maturation factor